MRYSKTFSKIFNTRLLDTKNMNILLKYRPPPPTPQPPKKHKTNKQIKKTSKDTHMDCGICFEEI